MTNENPTEYSNKFNTSSSEIKRLCFFFGLAYFTQGIGQSQAGMLSQVLKFYFTKFQGMTSTNFADYIAPLILPWVIKPIYGLISDLFPIGKYRRKSYLMLTSGFSILAFFSLLFASDNNLIRVALFCAGFGIAFGDVLVDALMVENGQRTGRLRSFQGLQWMWMSIAGVAAALIGGQLTEHLTAPVALRVAACIATLPLVALFIASLRMVREEETALSRTEVIRSIKALSEVFRSKTLWKMAVILFFVNFAPNTGVAWYTYETETLKIPQSSIGIAGAIESVGMVLGAFFFNWKLSSGNISQRRLLAICLILSAAGTCLYLLISGVVTLFVIAFIGGLLGMIAQIAMLSLAGEACPKRAEGFTFAALMGINNLAGQWGTQVGSRIFDGTGKILWPLILISAGTTLFALVFLPLLPKVTHVAHVNEEDL
jgi:MFS family permease